MSSILDQPANDKKRYSMGKTKNESMKESSLSNGKEEPKKASSRKSSKKKQSNYLNYKKQLTTSRNVGPSNSNSLASHFYSNRSANEPSYTRDSDVGLMEAMKSELIKPKSSLRKNVYESMPKKSINERKGSTPANYSVITDTYSKPDDSMAQKYSTSRIITQKPPNASFKYQGKSFSKHPKLPMSKSVK